MTTSKIVWSQWQGGLARHMADTSPHSEKFYEILRRFTKKASGNEEIYVCVWTGEFLYIEVHNKRWKHHPCKVRALVSFDVNNGLCASSESRNHYVFARRGWHAFMDQLVNFRVRRYTDCGQPAKTTRC